MPLLEALSERAAFINAEGIPWVLRLVMVGLGLSLTLADFSRVIAYPKAVTIGLAAQLVGIPLVAFALAFVFEAPPEIAVGLVIVAACPSGVAANAYSFAARADVPLCVTLSAITSLVTVFTIPLLIALGLQTFVMRGEVIQLPIFNMLLNLMSFTVVPLAIGMLVRFWFAEFAESAIEPIRKVVLWLMIGVLLLGVISSYQEILDHYVQAGAVIVAMNLTTMALGYGLARLFALPTPQVVTITFEVGVQNLALAFAITFTILQRPELAVSALIYAVVMPASALSFVWIARRVLARDALAAQAGATASASR